MYFVNFHSNDSHAISCEIGVWLLHLDMGLQSAMAHICEQLLLNSLHFDSSVSDIGLLIVDAGKTTLINLYQIEPHTVTLKAQ